MIIPYISEWGVPAEVLTAYTSGLYTVASENCPRYDEFRDMFSIGQLASKFWVIDKLQAALALTSSESNFNVIVVGGWFGTLGMLCAQISDTTVTVLDSDPRCAVFMQTVLSQHINAVKADMFDYDYSAYNVVINTSCEHITDVFKWRNMLHSGAIVVAQSNSSSSEDGHVNPTQNVQELIDQLQLSEVLYAGELEFPMYTRHMVIGIA